jgi:lysozyme
MSEAAAKQIAVDRLIKPFEGLRLEAYWDAIGGVWTIGYGHTGGVTPGQVISQSQADAYLDYDVTWALVNVERYVSVVLNENQFAALISFEFNTGAGRASRVFACVDNKDNEGAMNTLLLWDHDGNGNVIPGLLRRRQAEKALFNAKPSQA